MDQLELGIGEEFGIGEEKDAAPPIQLTPQTRETLVTLMATALLAVAEGEHEKEAGGEDDEG